MVGYAASPTRTVYVDVTVTPSKVMVKDGAFELPTIAHNCTLLGQSPPSFSNAVQN